MFSSSNLLVRVSLLSLVALFAVQTNGAYGTATSFVGPTGWSVGDPLSTYQEWDVFTGSTGNTPDAGYTTNPSIGTMSTLDAVPPAFVAGSGNFYSFASHYGFVADIYNHGGSYGAGFGTWVTVQTSATLNPDYDGGVDSDTMLLTNLVGGSLVGGTYAEVLNYAVLFEGIVSSTFGDVTQREEIWEFFLPGYFGDVQVSADVFIHSSFDQLRVDTFIGAAPQEEIPEPFTATLLAIGGGLAIARRGRNLTS